jgi:hypothetical protein
MRDTWTERNLLDKERRDLISKLMEPHEEYFRNKRNEIMSVCEHNFKFSGIGPIGHVWFHCTKCGKSKVEDE